MENGGTMRFFFKSRWEYAEVDLRQQNTETDFDDILSPIAYSLYCFNRKKRLLLIRNENLRCFVSFAFLFCQIADPKASDAI